LKDVLQLECDDYDDVQANRGLTLHAFKAFNRILIRMLKMEICWAILRYFGYDNNLDIKPELWDDQTIPEEDLKECRSFEF